jgi:hypothetical protein
MPSRNALLSARLCVVVAESGIEADHFSAAAQQVGVCMRPWRCTTYTARARCESMLFEAKRSLTNSSVYEPTARSAPVAPKILPVCVWVKMALAVLSKGNQQAVQVRIQWFEWKRCSTVLSVVSMIDALVCSLESTLSAIISIREMRGSRSV